MLYSVRKDCITLLIENQLDCEKWALHTRKEKCIAKISGLGEIIEKGNHSKGVENYYYT